MMGRSSKGLPLLLHNMQDAGTLATWVYIYQKLAGFICVRSTSMQRMNVLKQSKFWLWSLPMLPMSRPSGYQGVILSG